MNNHLHLVSIVIILLNIINITHTISCLNHLGQPISWWVILKVPPTIGNSGYAYYDSNSKSGVFQFINKTVDLDVSALSNTFLQLNNVKYQLQTVAWNDQKPNNTTSSTKAHSKGLITYDKSQLKGYFIVHSLPKYPQFFSNHTINITIPKAQQVYGQHITCFSLSLYQLQRLAYNLLIIHPNIYESTITLKSTTKNLYDLSKSIFPVNSNLFQYYQFRPQTYYINSIYKNNNLNGSIFQDGLVKYLSSGKLLAETWGRPLQQPWCYQNYTVNNVLQIKINNQIMWGESKDHSKWAIIGQKYSCFGDMNRMPSQWKRGGAFYCIIDNTLNAAMQKIVQYSDYCKKNNIKNNKENQLNTNNKDNQLNKNNQDNQLNTNNQDNQLNTNNQMNIMKERNNLLTQ